MSDDAHKIELQTYALAQAIGWALSTWTIIETNLTRLFLTVSEMRDLNKAHLVMEAVVSFDARLKMVCNLMDVVNWADNERAIWKRLVKRLRAQQSRRNELAHFQFVNVSDGQKTTPYVSPYFSQGAALRGEIKKLTEKEIWDREARFRSLAVAIGWFADAAKSLKRPKTRLPEDTPLIAEIRASI